MFVFVSHLSVPPGARAELERHFRERSRRVDGFPERRCADLAAADALEAAEVLKERLAA